MKTEHTFVYRSPWQPIHNHVRFMEWNNWCDCERSSPRKQEGSWKEEFLSVVQWHLPVDKLMTIAYVQLQVLAPPSCECARFRDISCFRHSKPVRCIFKCRAMWRPISVGTQQYGFFHTCGATKDGDIFNYFGGHVPKRNEDVRLPRSLCTMMCTKSNHSSGLVLRIICPRSY